MSDSIVHKVMPDFAATAHIDADRYEKCTKRPSRPRRFWAEKAERFVFALHTVSHWDYHTGEIRCMRAPS